MSYWLTRAGREHVILERGRLGERWRSERWDSLTVLTPNWAVTLPGHPYASDDPDGFMGKDEVTAFLEDYASTFNAPLRTGVTVKAVRVAGSARFQVDSDHTEIEAANVVAATGPFQQPSLPAWSTEVPAGVYQIHSSRYRNPGQLPQGAVLIVGAGSSGQQIAEDLLAANRRVYLSVGRYRPAHRRYRGYDWTWWQQRIGYFDRVVDDHIVDQPAIAQTGVGGGHELNLRQMAAEGGVTLLGHLRGINGATVHAAPDLAESIRAGDENIATFRSAFDDCIVREGIPAPPDPPRQPLPDPSEMSDPILELDLDAVGITTIIWATGFHYAFDWVQLPVFDATGRPQHHRGVTACPGMYFLGLRRLHKVKSSFLLGVGEDAAYLAERIAGHD